MPLVALLAAQQSMSANKIAKIVAQASVSTRRHRARPRSRSGNTTWRKACRYQARRVKRPQLYQAHSGKGIGNELSQALSGQRLSAADSLRPAHLNVEPSSTHPSSLVEAIPLAMAARCEHAHYLVGGCMARVDKIRMGRSIVYEEFIYFLPIISCSNYDIHASRRP